MSASTFSLLWLRVSLTQLFVFRFEHGFFPRGSHYESLSVNYSMDPQHADIMLKAIETADL